MRFLPPALGLCGLLLSACSGGPQVDTAKARAFVEEGREAAKGGDHAKAVSLYSRAIEADPQLPDAWVERGYSNVRLRLDANSPGNAREYEERALVDYSQAIELNRELGAAYYNRAMVYSSRAMYRQAADDLLNAIRYRPQDPEPHFAIAQIYEQKFDDMMPQAYEHYEKYADLGGRDRDAREKARFSREQKKAKAALPKAPTEEDEKKAEEIHGRAMALLGDEKTRAEGVKLVEELLSVYARTRFIQDPKRLTGLKAVLGAFKKEPPK